MVALWVTNRERLRAFVQAELLPAWGLAPAAEWFWLKVTARGALVTPLVRDPTLNPLHPAAQQHGPPCLFSLLSLPGACQCTLIGCQMSQATQRA